VDDGSEVFIPCEYIFYWSESLLYKGKPGCFEITAASDSPSLLNGHTQSAFIGWSLRMASIALSARPQLVNRSITTAIVIVSVLYTFFALTVVGISGDITSPDAFTGLYDVLGPTVVMIGSLLGILTTSTSFVMLGAALFETFTLDYRVPRLAAWGLTIVPPVGLFLSGLRNAIDVIGLAGGVAIGVQCVVILLAYLAMLRATISLQVRSRLLAYILVGILVVAGITQYWTP
jgi:hypothetical protein